MRRPGAVDLDAVDEEGRRLRATRSRWPSAMSALTDSSVL
jgi:hypothetical protein